MAAITDGGFTYRSAGVDIDAGEEAVRLIKADVESTYIPGVVGSLGGFAGLFEIPKDLKDPVLVTGTDMLGKAVSKAVPVTIDACGSVTPSVTPTADSTSPNALPGRTIGPTSV